MLVLVLGWTQCLPQEVDAPPAMLRGRTDGFPKKTGRPGLRRGGVGGYNLHRVAPTVALWHTNHEQAVSVWCHDVGSSHSSETT